MAFRGVLSGQIGRRFLKFYYKRIIEKGVIFAWLDGDTVYGFVSGIDDDKKLNSVSYYIFALKGIIIHFCQSGLYLSLIRHRKRMQSFNRITIRPELLSIAVDEAMRGKGIGMKLVGALEDYFRTRNISAYKVYTDTVFSTGFRLYEKMNFVLEKEVDLYGLPFRLYQKKME